MAASKLLANTLKKIIQEPVEGFAVELADESNLFEWNIFIEGPKETVYEGGVFHLVMKFPPDYPMSPPELRFISDFWHPNVYKDTGVVCISILHPPGEDEMSGELASERWLPTQTVTTILLSVISLLASPNFSSPANVDASVEWRNHFELYQKKIARLIEKANKEKPTHVVIPHPDTNAEEREQSIQKIKDMNKPPEEDDFMNQVDNVVDNENEEEEEDQKSEGNSSEDSSDKSNNNNKKNKTKSKGKGKVSDNSRTSKKVKGKTKHGKSSKKKVSKEEANLEDKDTKDTVETSPPELTSSKTKKKKCTIM